MKLDPYTGKANYRGWPKGVDNRRADHDVADDALRDGVNVDIRNSGRVQMRRGIQQAVAVAGAHSVFSDGLRMLWATATTLRLANTLAAPSILLTDPRLADPLSYVALNGEVYFSNERINGKVNALGAYEAWGIVPPTSQPACIGSPVASGETARRYQVTCTYVAADGSESGTNLVPVSVLCGDPPNIVVTAIPQSPDARVVATRLYATNIDGEIFYRDQDVPDGVTTVAMNGYFASGGPLRTQYATVPPLGQLLEYLNGRLYIAQGSVLWFTDALNYDIHVPMKHFMMFSDRITMVKAVPDGLFVSADQTYFVASPGTDDVVRRVAVPCKAIEGAACNLPDTTDVIWFSERGFVRGGTGGAIKMLTDAQIAVDKYARGALSFDESDGHRSIIAALSGPTAGNASTDFTAADVVRRAEIL